MEEERHKLKRSDRGREKKSGDCSSKDKVRDGDFEKADRESWRSDREKSVDDDKHREKHKDSRHRDKEKSCSRDEERDRERERKERREKEREREKEKEKEKERERRRIGKKKEERRGQGRRERWRGRGKERRGIGNGRGTKIKRGKGSTANWTRMMKETMMIMRGSVVKETVTQEIAIEIGADRKERKMKITKEEKARTILLQKRKKLRRR